MAQLFDKPSHYLKRADNYQAELKPYIKEFFSRSDLVLPSISKILEIVPSKYFFGQSKFDLLY